MWRKARRNPEGWTIIQVPPTGRGPKATAVKFDDNEQPKVRWDSALPTAADFRQWGVDDGEGRGDPNAPIEPVPI